MGIYSSYDTIYKGSEGDVTYDKIDKRTKAWRNREWGDSHDLMNYPGEVSLTNAIEESRLEATEEGETTSRNPMQNPLRNLGSRGERSGSLGNNMGAISVQTPHVIVSRPTLSLPDNYGHYHGFPSNITAKLGDLRGYTKVADIHLENIPAQSSEINIMDKYLKSGVIINREDHSDPNVFTLYTNNSDLNTIRKKLTSLTTESTIRLKQPTDIVSPTFIISGVTTANIINSNYLYYPDFGRYYYIENKVNTANDVWEIQCSCDAIESFRNQILNLKAVLDKQEFVYNMYLDDGTLKAYSYPQVLTKNFPVSFNSLGTQYIIVAVGQ